MDGIESRLGLLRHAFAVRLSTADHSPAIRTRQIWRKVIWQQVRFHMVLSSTVQLLDCQGREMTHT